MSRPIFLCTLLLCLSTAAEAFGPEGHVIAGLLAEPQLCAAARDEIKALDRDARADLSDFVELGLWADRLRSDPQWRQSGPWHYMNVAGDVTNLADARRLIRAFVHPAEHDVLWAIEHFSALLADRTQSPSTRADALRFVVHFVVDIHQPLHVGLARDRGGNEINVRYGTKVVNLHRFWDTDVIRLRDWSPQRYARYLAAQPPSAVRDADADPQTWAAESLLLRPRIYAGLRQQSAVQSLSAAYLNDAQASTEQRLVLAGRRLASTLNRLLCR
jgi:hypothetical protein